MPSLDPEDRIARLGPVGGECSACDGPRIRHYCRTCDVFFVTCGCFEGRESVLGQGAVHGDHRVYLWTPTGVIAVPDFDTFGD